MKRFSIFCGLFSKTIQITFRPKPKRVYGQFSGENIEKMVAYLRTIWTEIIGEVTTYPLGNLYTYLDPKGNAIELWEANDNFFSDLMGPTNKKAGHKPDSVVPYH